MKFAFIGIVVAACAVGAVQLQKSGSADTESEKPGSVDQVAAQDKNPKQDDEEQTEVARFMRKKLAASNKILEGLCVDDMTLVDQGAAALLKMSDAERWRASTDMMYLHHSREFRRAVETLQQKAKKKNPDGSALAWVDVTMSCIRCHAWVRDTMVADANRDFDSPLTETVKPPEEGNSK